MPDAGATPPRPAVVAKPIAFPAARKLEMQAYAKRHYGIDTWRLRNPKVIVEHITVSSTFGSAYATFAADVPDSELHELPGTCAHFVVDTDGTIYQLVPLEVMCRHTVGLNWTAIGIEHVGLSDAQVLGNARQLAASLALTTWLMSRYHIGLGDVIGHNESLTSRFHHESLRGLALPDARRLEQGRHEHVPRAAGSCRQAERRTGRTARAHGRRPNC